MSDFNVVIVAVDSAMDAVTLFQREISDLNAHVTFDSRSLLEALYRKIAFARDAVESVQNQIDALQAATADSSEDSEIFSVGEETCELHSMLWKRQTILRSLEQIQVSCSDYLSELLEQFQMYASSCQTQADEAIRFMGRYIHDLNLISNREASELGTYRASEGYYVCVLDASLHPSTAEHICAAQRSGQPTRLIIDRSGVAQRRENSLQDIPVRSEFDRDEYPMALFLEGGTGADVAYLEGPDNRGAGSYIAWQLRGVPDGAEVRIRVV